MLYSRIDLILMAWHFPTGHTPYAWAHGPGLDSCQQGRFTGEASPGAGQTWGKNPVLRMV